MSGVLFVVATPIGHLGDMTFRAVETLRSVNVIACEDTRRTQKLMAHFGLNKPLLRYDEYTHSGASERILQLLEEGKSVALVTDAGTPAVSDPGVRLVQKIVNAHKEVIPIPGPSAAMAAFSVSGFEGDGFTFVGFLPRRPGRAKRQLQELLGLGRTIVIFESPFRTKRTLETLAELAPTARVVMARELTKVHEELLRGTVAEVLHQLKNRELLGEVVLVIKPQTGCEDHENDESKH